MLCSVHGFVYTPRRCANPSSSHHQSRGEGKEETRGPTALVAEYVTRRRRPRDGGACTVPLTTATHTHVRARTAESRGGTPRQDPGNECAVRTTEPAGCSVPSPRRRSACTRARRQRYLAWPGHRRTLLPPWALAPPPRPLLAGSGSCPKLAVAGQRHHHHLFVSSPRPHAREVGRTVVSPPSPVVAGVACRVAAGEHHPGATVPRTRCPLLA